ncbi:MAG: ribosome small subunit-dependent GTPase A [Thermoguttaceae bacterium]|jgi:ribosome biogenesis GTPase
MAKKKKFRAEFKKNRSERTRQTDWTRKFKQDAIEEGDLVGQERVSGKGELTRRRTITGIEREEGQDTGIDVQLEVDEAACLRGRVLSVYGLASIVQTFDGTLYRCVTRRLLKTLAIDQRHSLTAGDEVLFRPIPNSDQREGVVERIEPRHGVISRATKGKQHVMVANVDQALLVSSAAEPTLKPNLIDRLLVTAEKTRIRPIVCINKVDLVDPASLEPLVGVYSQMGYQVLLLSVRAGVGIERLRRVLSGRASVVVGQSGVGKSSLLNSVEPALSLPVASVSVESLKGRHTTTAARLLPLSFGGYVVDTPGVRQFQLWDVIREEVGGFFRDFRPYVNHCRFPNCTHTHEADCAIKDAVADGHLDDRRYDSYCRLFAGEFD